MKGTYFVHDKGHYPSLRDSAWPHCLCGGLVTPVIDVIFLKTVSFAGAIQEWMIIPESKPRGAVQFC
jgi:hypothetical protein